MRESPFLGNADGLKISICKNCGDARLLPSQAIKIPSADEYAAFLEGEVAAAKTADRSARWYNGKVVSYAQESRLRALVEVDAERNQYFNLDAGDDCERRYGKTVKKGWVQAVVGQRLTLYVDLFDEEMGASEEVQVRKPQAMGLALTQQQAFDAIRAATDDVDGLLDPTLLPPLDHTPFLTPAGIEQLNDGQRAAVEHGLRTPEQGISLIQGPPGTGKTMVIAHLIRLLRAAGETVLVAAHTHVAIDNALERALSIAPELKAEIARLGTASKISDAMEPYYRHRDEFETADLEDGPPSALFTRYPVVGMTLASLAARMKHTSDAGYAPFGYVIVDEASMNLLPPTLVARAAGHRLILVGDHLQLPPIITDESYAKRTAFSRSSFEQLALARPDLIARLRVQYRSLPGIMSWSNHVLYADDLVDHRTDAVARWTITGHEVEATTVWIDTAKLPKNEHLARWSPGAGSASFGNPRHVALAMQVAKELVQQGIDPSQIGYIAPFRLQAAVFRALAQRHLKGGYRIQSSTVDSFQGREKGVIIYDFTTTEPQKSHASANRLNVSLTRARDLSIILGPTDFTAGPAANAAYWSLQKWRHFQRILPQCELEAAWVSEADVAIRTGQAAPVSRLTNLRDLIDRVEYTDEHHVLLTAAYEKRADEQAAMQKLWILVSKVAPSTNVKALYAELCELDSLPHDENKEVKSAILGVRGALSYSGDPKRRHLMLIPRADALRQALLHEPALSDHLAAEVARLQRLLHEEGIP